MPTVVGGARWTAGVVVASVWLSQTACGAPPIEIAPGRDAVRVQCRVARQGTYEVLQGRIEYVLCGTAGKGYESLLLTEADPRELRDALLALGLRPGAPARREGDVDFLPRGGRLRLSLELERNGAREVRPLGDVIRDLEKNAPLGPAAWVFTGSLPGRDPATGAEVHQSSLTGNLIALHHRDASVLVQNAQERGRDFRRFAPESSAMPPEGTPVTLIIELEKTVRRRYVVHGRVQGVGFRAFTERTARQGEVGGWVRNRADGTVEIEAEFLSEDQRKRFEETIARGPRGAAVERVDGGDPVDPGPLPAVFETRDTE